MIYTRHVDNKFAERVKQRMKAVGINQAELSQRIGIGQSQLSRLLNGERGTDLETVKRIATALGESQQLYINLYADLPMTQKDIYFLEIEEDLKHIEAEEDKERIRQVIRILAGGGGRPGPKKAAKGQRVK